MRKYLLIDADDDDENDANDADPDTDHDDSHDHHDGENGNGIMMAFYKDNSETNLLKHHCDDNTDIDSCEEYVRGLR